MSLKKVFGICVYALSAVAALFVFINIIPQIGAIFQALFSTAFLGGFFLLVLLVVIVLWLVFSILGLVLHLTKGPESGKKSKKFGLYCARIYPFVAFVCASFAVFGMYVFSNPESALQYLAALFQVAGTYIILISSIAAALLYKIADKQQNPVTVAVLKGIGVVLVLVAGIVLGGGALAMVGIILGVLALALDIVVPFLKD